MPVPVTMPQLGESVTEGTVTRWLKQVGDSVVADEPLVEVSTDKVDTEIPAPISGILMSITAAEDEIVAVGAVLGVLGDAGEAPEAAPEPASAALPPPAAPVAPTPPAQPVVGPITGTAITLPELGESVTEGTVTRWLKSVGDPVAADEAVVEISTDKVDTEIPSPVAGTLLRIIAPRDSSVPVGGTLAVVGQPAGTPAPALPAPPVPQDPTTAPLTPPPAPIPAVPVPTSSPSASPVDTSARFLAPTTPRADHEISAPEPDTSASYVTPLVRKLAAERGVDLTRLKGSGVGGRIRRQDVLAASVSVAEGHPPEEPAPTAAGPAVPTPATSPRPTAAATVGRKDLRGRTEKLDRLRRVIAERMVESLRVSAQLTTVVEVDVTRIATLRDHVQSRFASREGIRLSFLPFFAKATVEALKSHPNLNASIDLEENTVTYHDREHLGVAVDTDRGLLVPVIRDAGDLNIVGLARRVADLAERTRTNRVTPDELSGGTFTLTNTGSRGALFDTPIVNQPQVAILGTGAVVRRPVVVPGDAGADSIAVRSMVYFALTYDHRLVDGADAARFLMTIKQRLEEGAFEGELGI